MTTPINLREVLPAAYTPVTHRPMADQWIAHFESPMPSGGVMIMDDQDRVIAIATDERGFSGEPDAPPPLDPLDIARNGKRIAAVPDLMACARQLATFGPGLQVMLQKAGLPVPIAFATAVRLAERLMRDLPR